jgi:hypothetical protein
MVLDHHLSVSRKPGSTYLIRAFCLGTGVRLAYTSARRGFAQCRLLRPFPEDPFGMPAMDLRSRLCDQRGMLAQILLGKRVDLPRGNVRGICFITGA